MRKSRRGYPSRLSGFWAAASKLMGAGEIFRWAVDPGHQEDLLPIPVAQRFPHFDFALSVPVVVVPGIVHERGAVIDRGADNSRRQIIGRRFADVGSANSQY